MKNHTFTLIIFFSVFSLKAQWNDNSINLTTSDNVGIGTTSPQSSLHINDTSKNIDNFIITTSPVGEAPDNIFVISNQNGSGVMKMKSRFGVEQVALNTEGNNYINGGNLGIGTTNPDMKLTVNGNIHAKEVKIDLNIPAPDYVFKKNYDLRTIEELEDFIEKNSHLPEIPSAKEFEQNGVMQAEMDMNLLKKIEELTLYTIQQEKKIKLLEKQTKEIKELKSMVKQLLES